MQKIRLKNTLAAKLFVPHKKLLLMGLFAFAAVATFGVILSGRTAMADVPYQMNFQGRLNDAAGVPMPNGTYNMRFRIFSAATGGSALWTETHAVGAGQGVDITEGGLFSTQLGAVTSLPPSIFNTSSPLYLEIELPAPASATTTSPVWTEGPLTPRNPISSSPYAINSAFLDGMTAADFAAATGSTGYIQNQSSGVQSASFWISGNGRTSGNLTADGNLSIGGTAQFKNTSDSAGAFQVQRADGSNLLLADTQNQRVTVGSVGTSSGQLYVGGTLPSTPISSTHPVGGWVNGVNLYKGYWYSYNSSGNDIYLMNANDPGNLTYAGAVLSDFMVQAMTIRGDYMYVVSDGNFNNPSLGIIDLSTPTKPKIISNWKAPAGSYVSGSFTDVGIQGKYAYISDGSVIDVVDISNPAEPQLASSYKLSDTIDSFQISGNRLYALHDAASTGKALQIFDISNPLTISRIGSLANDATIHNVGTYAINGDKIYVAGHDSTLNADNGWVIDASDQTTPTVESTFTISDWPAMMKLAGNRLYIATQNGGVLAYDVSDHSTPDYLGYMNVALGTTGMDIIGRYMYILTGGYDTIDYNVFDLGGTYTQSLQAGTVQVGKLDVDSDVMILGSLDTKGTITTAGIKAGSIGSNQLTISSNSQAPVALLGSTAIDTSDFISMGANKLYAAQFTTGATNQDVASLNFYAGAVDQQYPHYKMAIYTDNAGVAGSLVVASGEALATANRWNSAPVATTTLSASTTYWIVLTTESGTTQFANVLAGNCNRADATNTYSSGLPATWPGNSSTATSGCSAFSASAAPVYADSNALQVNYSDGTAIFNVDTYGRNVTVQGDNTNMFSVQGAAGNSVLSVNTINSKVTLTGIDVSATNVSSTWTTRTVPSAYWKDVTYANGQYVVVGGDSAMTSPDGLTWTTRTVPTGDWDNVIYADGEFVAMKDTGSSKSIMTSPDGVTWTAQTTPSNSWYSVTYADGKFVAVGSGAAMTSPDGVTWTAQTVPSQTWIGVTYAEGKFVAVGDNAAMTSPDGVTWTAQTVPSGWWSGVAYGGGEFVAVSNDDSGSAMVSPDGITWTYETIPYGRWWNITYLNSQFFAVSPYAPFLITSTFSAGLSIGGGLQVNGNQHVDGDQVVSGKIIATGSVFFGGATSSSTALVVQDAAGMNVLTVDTTNQVVQIGNVASGNYLTLNGNGGLTAYGTARHQKTILLTPEYAGAVLDAASDAACSSANSGTLTAGYDSANRMNYYNWSSTQTSAQCYDVVVQVPLPSDFDGWVSAPNIQVAKDSTGTAAYAIQIIPSSGSDANYGSYTSPGTLSTSWANMATSNLSGAYTAGDYMTIKVRLSSTSSANVKLGNIKLSYYSKF